MTEREQKIQEILEQLKEEVFVELDRRVRNSERSIAKQFHNELDERIEGEIARQMRPWKKELFKRIRRDMGNFQESLRVSHRIPYAAIVVLGFFLFWYGFVSILAQVPLLSNGFVALGTGLLLLIISGATYKKLVG